MVRGSVQRRRFSGGGSGSPQWGRRASRKFDVMYIFTARRRIGWVGDALTFWPALFFCAPRFAGRLTLGGLLLPIAGFGKSGSSHFCRLRGGVAYSLTFKCSQ